MSITAVHAMSIGLTNLCSQYVQAEMIEEEWTTEPWS